MGRGTDEVGGWDLVFTVLRFHFGMWKKQGPFPRCAGPTPVGRLNYGKSCFDFFFLYGPGGPESENVSFSARISCALYTYLTYGSSNLTGRQIIVIIM